MSGVASDLLIVNAGSQPDFDQVKKALEIVQRYAIIAKLRTISPSPVFAEIKKRFVLGDTDHLNVEECFYGCPIMELNVFIDEVFEQHFINVQEQKDIKLNEEKKKRQKKKSNKKTK